MQPFITEVERTFEEHIRKKMLLIICENFMDMLYRGLFKEKIDFTEKIKLKIDFEEYKETFSGKDIPEVET